MNIFSTYLAEKHFFLEICKISLRGPTHQKWSNFAIFGFIVQFDPSVGAHLWEKIRVLGELKTPQMGPPPFGGFS